MIELYSTPTPNGQKVMIMLEETGLAWKHIDVNIRERMAKAAEGKPAVNIYDTKDNAERLAKASKS